MDEEGQNELEAQQYMLKSQTDNHIIGIKKFRVSVLFRTEEGEHALKDAST